VTSAVPEASVVSHRSAKPERATRPTGMRPEAGGFAALMDEARPEPKQSQTRTRDRVNPAEKTEAASAAPASNAPASTSREPASESSDAEQAANDAATAAIPTEPLWTELTLQPGETAPAAIESATDEELATGTVVPPEAAIPEAPDTALVPPVIPAPDPAAAPAVAVDGSAQAAAAAALPAGTPAEAAAAAKAAAGVVASDIEGAADPAKPTQTPAQSGIAGPVIKAAAPATTEDSGEDAADAADPLLSGTDMADTEAAALQVEAQKQPKQTGTPAEASSQSAPARQEATPDTPDLRPDAAAMPEEPAPTSRPAVDPTAQTAQLSTPAPGHVAVAQAATPHAMPVTTAQPVPVDAIAVEIASQARAGNSRFEIRLDPPELGRIDVRLDVDREGNVKSRLVIERSDTYDLLRRDQSTLERALQQAGLKTSDNSLEFSLRDQGFAQHRDADEESRGTRAMIHDTEVAPSEAANGYARLLGARGGIDIRV
jgi:flagellar hook-length control protein FliK